MDEVERRDTREKSGGKWGVGGGEKTGKNRNKRKMTIKEK